MNLSMLGLNNIPYILLGIVGLGFIIGFHELGHFLFCKLFKVHTPTFSIGFGPQLLAKKIGDTMFTLSAIPLGGYVEIAGAAEVGQGEQTEAHRDDEYSFKRKPYWQKLLILLGGIIFNVIFAFVAFLYLSFAGVPKTPLLYPMNGSTQISVINENSPALQAGLQVNDVITSINGQATINAPDIITIIESLPDTDISLSVSRNGESKEIALKTSSKMVGDKKIGMIGVGFTPTEIKATSLQQGFSLAWQMLSHSSSLIWSSLVNLFKEGTFKRVGGPLMIISQTIQGAKQGISVFILLLAFISINLAIFNLIPLPILDGGQIVTYTIEAMIGRSLPESFRYAMHLGTWLLFMLLFVLLTFKDASSLGWFSAVKDYIASIFS
jgi:regulator of sigma E protease